MGRKHFNDVDWGAGTEKGLVDRNNRFEPEARLKNVPHKVFL